MNREAIKKVRDVIAGLPRGRFTMEYYASEPGRFGEDIPPGHLAHTCNTAGCIAGWTVAALAPNAPRGEADEQAAELLGIDHPDALALFMPPGYDTPRLYSQPHAVRVLDHLLATGEVDWKTTRRAKKTSA